MAVSDTFTSTPATDHPGER